MSLCEKSSVMSCHYKNYYAVQEVHIVGGKRDREKKGGWGRAWVGQNNLEEMMSNVITAVVLSLL